MKPSKKAPPKDRSVGQIIYLLALGMAIAFSVIVSLFLVFSGWFEESFSEALIYLVLLQVPIAAVIGIRRLVLFMMRDVLGRPD